MCVCVCVCDRWATQTTIIDIAPQNSEVTVSLGRGGGGGGLQWGGGGVVVGRQQYLVWWLGLFSPHEKPATHLPHHCFHIVFK